jgi:hypothetical protein
LNHHCFHGMVGLVNVFKTKIHLRPRKDADFNILMGAACDTDCLTCM